METKQWTTVDKSKWPTRGKWDSEPDKMQWQDEATSLPCLIVRGPAGALCGYVGVAEGHPMFGKEYGTCVFPEKHKEHEGDAEDYHYNCTPQGELECHGGITFSDFCADSEDESKHICHAPGPGEPDRVFWFGFDCAHSGDYCPSYDRGLLGGSYSSYKDLDYVQGEVRRLAKQLAAFTPR